MTASLHATATAAEEYIERHLFDECGLMLSGIDSHTHQPYRRQAITPRQVPRRAAFDPWSYQTYEDSVMGMGFYLDGLVLRYEVTGDPADLRRAARLWTTIERVYSASQVHGIGSFLRPYGGYERMHQFLEPLGTDQAGPLFHGLYRYLDHVDGEQAEDVRRVMRNTLGWYVDQGFKYFYYKTFIHGGMRSVCHANSYYLPALAWAADLEPGQPRWRDHLELRLDLYQSGAATLYPHGRHPTFNWASDLDVLRRILGARFDVTFPAPRLEAARREALEQLGAYEPPGRCRRICPESAEPGFVPRVDEPETDRDLQAGPDIGYLLFHTRHHGRRWVRHERHVLLGLAAVGYRTQETTRRVSELLSAQSRVPGDFTAWWAGDYDRLPDTVAHSARTVGIHLVGWWRDYWLLRHILECRTQPAGRTP